MNHNHNGKKNPMYGRKQSVKTKELISIKAKKRYENPEYRTRIGKFQEEYEEALKNPPLCVCGCGEYIEIKSGHNSRGIPKYIHNHHGRDFSKEVRNKISISSSGNQNGFFGKTHTLETRKKIRIANLGINNHMVPQFIKELYNDNEMEEIWKEYGKDNCDCCEMCLKSKNWKDFVFKNINKRHLKKQINGGLMYYREEGDEWLTLCRHCYKSVTEIEDVFL